MLQRTEGVIANYIHGDARTEAPQLAVCTGLHYTNTTVTVIETGGVGYIICTVCRNWTVRLVFPID